MTVRSLATPAWNGSLKDISGNLIGGATIRLQSTSGKNTYLVTSTEHGEFHFGDIASGNYQLTVTQNGKTWHISNPVLIDESFAPASVIELFSPGGELRIIAGPTGSASSGTGGEYLSKEKVSSLPLNER